MSELIELPLLDLGPRVAIIDDRDEDARPIEQAFDNLHVGNKYFNVDAIQPNFPDHPLKDVEMVFLDLHYENGFGADFDPYRCIDWLARVVPNDQRYILVIWSRDIQLTEILLQTMQELKVTMPYYVDTKDKQVYRIGEAEYDIEKLLQELGVSLQKEYEINITEFFGKILEVDDEAVLINCLINENPNVFEIRRFDREPFKYMSLEEGGFLKIRIKTKPGTRIIDFISEHNDLSEKFIKNAEEPFGEIDWLNTADE